MSRALVWAVSPLLGVAILLLIFLVGYKRALERGENSLLMRLIGRTGSMQALRVLYMLGEAFPERYLGRMCKAGKVKAKLLDKTVPEQKKNSDKPLICFAGSSTFTYWINLQSYFPAFSVFNAAFGGSVTSLVLELADDLVVKHQPKAVVYYCGTNDMSLRLDPDEVVDNFKRFHEHVRKHVASDVGFVYVSMLPTPSNVTFDSPKIIATMLRANRRIEEFCAGQSKSIFIKAASERFASNPDFFLFDNKHLLPRGHAKLAALILPALEQLNLKL